MEAAGCCCPDAELRGQLVGLTERLEQYFSRQLRLNEELKGERCPGEERCRNTFGKPLFIQRHSEPEAVCPGCRFYETKPGMQPRHMVDAVNTALELDTVKECGGTFAYPDALTPYQWACLKGLHAGRGAHQERESIKRRREMEKQSTGGGGDLFSRIATGNPIRPVR